MPATSSVCLPGIHLQHLEALGLEPVLDGLHILVAGPELLSKLVGRQPFVKICACPGCACRAAVAAGLLPVAGCASELTVTVPVAYPAKRRRGRWRHWPAGEPYRPGSPGHDHHRLGQARHLLRQHGMDCAKAYQQHKCRQENLYFQFETELGGMIFLNIVRRRVPGLSEKRVHEAFYSRDTSRGVYSCSGTRRGKVTGTYLFLSAEDEANGEAQRVLRCRLGSEVRSAHCGRRRRYSTSPGWQPAAIDCRDRGRNGEGVLPPQSTCCTALSVPS